ncbi:jg15623 [Pararge aegeria aegeria]|uniref:Jg15623 protein n=1 Tax=Pararge aegeria aegeria TaxID=348720 RepID=A0A8S4RSP2_9NEOP|nr:jg15623 [Pararge aegeria aegeria]
MEEQKEENEKVNLDEILQNEIGQIGWFQLRLVLLAGVVVIFIGWGTSEYLFTAARIPTRCYIPECEGQDARQFSPPWILNAVPASGSSFDSCRRFYPINSSNSMTEDCPNEKFNRQRIVNCEEYVYENTNTAVYDFSLACDEWRRTLIGSARTLGTLASLPITGFVSDRFGRRFAIVLSGFNAAWLGLIRYWSYTYVGFVMSEFAESMFGSGGFSSSYILIMEMTGPKYRVMAGAILNTFFAVGQMTTGLLAWAIPDWRNLTLALYVPQFLIIVYIWVIPESVRWNISKGRYRDAENLLKEAARVNKKKLSDKSLHALRHRADEEKKSKESQEEESLIEAWLPMLVFNNKAILLRTIVSPVWWITLTFVYYGLSINSVNMVGNRYLNFILVSAVEIPGYWTAVFLLGKIGRKPVLIGAYWMCAFCQIAYIFVPHGFTNVALAIYVIGKYSISLVITSLYVYTAELYPTKYRHRLFAFSSMIGRIGSVLAPLTPAFGEAVWVNLPFTMFAGFAMLSGFLVFITPETLGTKLPDTMEEASNIGVKKT